MARLQILDVGMVQMLLHGHIVLVNLRAMFQQPSARNRRKSRGTLKCCLYRHRSSDQYRINPVIQSCGWVTCAAWAWVNTEIFISHLIIDGVICLGPGTILSDQAFSMRNTLLRAGSLASLLHCGWRRKGKILPVVTWL